jgi:MFS family permease
LSSGKMRDMLSPSEALTRKNLRFNFSIGLLDGGFFGLGMGFASFAAIIPLFVHHMTESAILIGMVPAIHNMGFQLPQLLTAGWLSQARRYKPLTLLMTVHERLPFLGLAILALWMPHAGRSTMLLLTFLLLIWQGLGAGLAANPWTNLVSKVIPQEMHGTFFGAQSAAFSGLAGVSALGAGLILSRLAEPFGFSACFALTFVCMVISFGFLSATREADSVPSGEIMAKAFWGKSLAIFRRDRNFRAFLVVRVISQFAAMAFAFYVIYAVQNYGMSDAMAAVLVAVLLIGQVALSPIMGHFGDRWSHRGIMGIGGLAAALSALLAWRAPSSGWFIGVFLLEAAAIVAIWTIPLVMSVGFAERDEDRPLYVGLANTLPAPAAILAPVIGGWLVDTVGYGPMFVLSAISGLVMAAALWFVIKAPAQSRRRAVTDGEKMPGGAPE